MTKLTDTQLLILSKAAQRDDHAVEPPSDLKGAAAQKVVRKLIKDGLLAEAAGGPDLPVWRREKDGPPVSLLITAAGLDAIGIIPEVREEGSEPRTPPSAWDADDSSADTASVVTLTLVSPWCQRRRDFASAGRSNYASRLSA